MKQNPIRARCKVRRQVVRWPSMWPMPNAPCSSLRPALGRTSEASHSIACCELHQCAFTPESWRSVEVSLRAKYRAPDEAKREPHFVKFSVKHGCTSSDHTSMAMDMGCSATSDVNACSLTPGCAHSLCPNPLFVAPALETEFTVKYYDLPFSTFSWPKESICPVVFTEAEAVPHWRLHIKGILPPTSWKLSFPFASVPVSFCWTPTSISSKDFLWNVVLLLLCFPLTSRRSDFRSHHWAADWHCSKVFQVRVLQKRCWRSTQGESSRLHALHHSCSWPIDGILCLAGDFPKPLLSASTTKYALLEGHILRVSSSRRLQKSGGTTKNTAA